MQNNIITIEETTQWATTIFTAINPVHDQISEPLTAFVYGYKGDREDEVESGIAPGVKAGLFESKFNFFEQDNAAVHGLREFCAAAVLEVAKHVNGQYWQEEGKCSLEFHESWFHVTGQGGQHDIHYHANCSWCGIYYLDIGDATMDNGCNRFFDPRPAAHGYSDYGTAYISENCRFNTTPKNGNLVIFPSYLYHSAATYEGTKDRIVIAFNSSVHYTP